MTIEPLRNLPVVRDLVTEREPYEKLLAQLEPLLVRKAEYPGFPEPLSAIDMAPARHLRDCIQCLACVAACPVLEQPESGFAGPAALVALAELALDPRDGADRARLAEEICQVFKCVSC
ncbi:MAG: succinate dehydrogenase/fumarate reductase iron-sulfur subunit, partial [Euryarchaeota archaeon]|nr:succinate dehydrogenase/fumarate reductase iron-sulfur subunit [Euryarchaeota archaeon]